MSTHHPRRPLARHAAVAVVRARRARVGPRRQLRRARRQLLVRRRHEQLHAQLVVSARRLRLPVPRLAAAAEHVAELRRLLRRDDDEPHVQPDLRRQRSARTSSPSRSAATTSGSRACSCSARSGRCGTALNNTRNALPGSLNSKLDTVYTAIKNQAAPGGEGRRPRLPAALLELGLPRHHRHQLVGADGRQRSWPTRSTSTIAARAAAYGFTYKSAISSFTGHAVCSSSAWVNGLNIFNTTESFHPNRNGNSAGYLPLVRSVIG